MVFQFPNVYQIFIAMIYYYLFFNHLFEERNVATAQQRQMFFFCFEQLKKHGLEYIIIELSYLLHCIINE